MPLSSQYVDSDPTGQPLVRKERERIARRKEILDAARTVFAQKGYENATLDEIALKAEFAKGTLYNYFDSKEKLFDEIIAGMLDEMTELAKRSIAQGGSIREQFRQYADNVIEYYKSNEDILLILIRQISRMGRTSERAHLSHMMEGVSVLASVLADALKKEIHKKTIIKENPEDLAHMFVAMIHNRVVRRTSEPSGIQTINAQREAAFLVRLFFDGAALP